MTGLYIHAAMEDVAAARGLPQQRRFGRSSGNGRSNASFNPIEKESRLNSAFSRAAFSLEAFHFYSASSVVSVAAQLASTTWNVFRDAQFQSSTQRCLLLLVEWKQEMPARQRGGSFCKFLDSSAWRLRTGTPGTPGFDHRRSKAERQKGQTKTVAQSCASGSPAES